MLCCWHLYCNFLAVHLQMLAAEQQVVNFACWVLRDHPSRRCFCKHCGSPYSREKRAIDLLSTSPTLYPDFPFEPQSHTCCGSLKLSLRQAAFFKDDLPKYLDYPKRCRMVSFCFNIVVIQAATSQAVTPNDMVKSRIMWFLIPATTCRLYHAFLLHKICLLFAQCGHTQFWACPI